MTQNNNKKETTHKDRDANKLCKKCLKEIVSTKKFWMSQSSQILRTHLDVRTIKFFLESDRPPTRFKSLNQYIYSANWATYKVVGCLENIIFAVRKRTKMNQ